MSELVLHLPRQGTITLPVSCADKLIASHNPEAALLYIYIVRSDGRLDVRRAARDLGMTPDDLAEALAALQDMGLAVRPDDASAPAESRAGGGTAAMRSASVTANPIELSKIINGDAMFRHLLAELQRRMGKTLSGADLTTLHGIYSSLGLPAEVLMIMITHVFEETARRYGEGHRPGVRKLQKEAVFWSESGINTVERAESFVKSRDEKRQGQTVIAKMLSRGGRQLTDSEEKYIGRWLEMGFPPETVYKAYDRTVLNTGDLKWKYMDSILANWHKAGLHQPAEVEGYIPADDSKPARPRASGGARGTAAPFEPGANERDSVEWVKSMGRRKKGVDGGGL